ncbi:MAG: hypothetical protein M3Q98_13985 [Actinomycetota bacterium]|nr:hypothetical protein [Actinomycetota bacterium]
MNANAASVDARECGETVRRPNYWRRWKGGSAEEFGEVVFHGGFVVESFSRAHLGAVAAKVGSLGTAWMTMGINGQHTSSRARLAKRHAREPGGEFAIHGAASSADKPPTRPRLRNDPLRNGARSKEFTGFGQRPEPERETELIGSRRSGELPDHRDLDDDRLLGDLAGFDPKRHPGATELETLVIHRAINEA